MKWKGTSNLRSGNGCWTISWRALSIKDVPQSLAATSHWTLDWTLETWTCRDSCDFVQAAIPEEMTAFESFQSTDAVLQDINGLAIARAKRAGLPWFTKVEVTICSNPAGAQTQNDNGTRWIFRFAWNPFVLRSASKRMSLKIKTRDINGHLGPRWRCRGRSNQEMWGKGGEKYASSQVLVWKRADRDFRCKIGSVILLQVVFAPLDSEGSAPRMLMRPAVYFIFQYISTMSYSFQTISMLFYSWKTRTQVGHGLQAWHWVRKWLDALVSSRHCWLDCYFWRCNHWIITEHCHNWSPAQVRAMFTGGMPPGASLAFGFRLGCPTSGMRAIEKWNCISTWWGVFGLFSEPKHDSKTIKNMRISQCCMGKFSTYSNTQDWLQGYSMEVESLQRFQKLTKLRLGRAIWVEAPNIVPVFSDSASSEFLAWSRAPCYVRF